MYKIWWKPWTWKYQTLEEYELGKAIMNIFRIKPPMHFNCRSVIIPIPEKEMTVRDLIKKLKKMNQNLDAVIDLDENGWYSIDAVEEAEDSSGYCAVNIVSSNEA
jgi:hypothetical protein